MIATLWDQSGGRVELAIGVGGSGPELPSYGIALPDPATRSAILEEAVAVVRHLWSGGPASYSGRFFELHDAYAHPAPEPPPRIIVGGEKPAGARLAARIGDGWTTNGPDYERLLPLHLEALSAAGRSRAQIAHVIAVSIDKDVPLDRQPLFADMATFLGEWHDRGADEVVVSWVKPAELPALLEAGARAGIGA
jgi:alkanesulfonate monooxygenase SsuD/methylene tetrahydromethanopterin reductase-like flavin-dependent oxidoreductase (luciferase family)